MGPIWDRQDPGGPHVGPMNFAIWESLVWATGSVAGWDFHCQSLKIWTNLSSYFNLIGVYIKDEYRHETVLEQ